ncbi:GNAT family N-acetyltransferase [Acidiplasma cupricumulans]|uniref:GNAT family N-acetyltransferase n=1 Tax=Acidiplasma cupricumulans TaxID=312540 RepID=UPI00078113DE|nr:GNAT family N-acetyltransferase [Acidiplasma cupricumulans]
MLSSQISFDRAFILSIFVKKEHRNEGNGKYLLYSALNRLKALSYKYVYLWVNEKNTAYKMYGDAGFKFDNYPPEIIYYINKP